MPKSITFTTMFRTVLMMVRLPGLPVISSTLPPRATMVGVCERQHSLAGRDGVRIGADGAAARGFAGIPVEVDHLVVEQEPCPAYHDARSVASLQRVGVAHRHAVAIDHAEVRRAVAFVLDRHVFREVGAGGGFIWIDAPGELAGVFLGRKMRGDLDEVGVAQVTGAVAVGSPHGLRHQVQGRWRETSLFLQIEIFQHIEHFHQADAA